MAMFQVGGVRRQFLSDAWAGQSVTCAGAEKVSETYYIRLFSELAVKSKSTG